MHKQTSIVYTLMGVTFLLLAGTIGTLLFFVNQQMHSRFSDYVMHHAAMPAMMDGANMELMHDAMMGLPERTFLTSVHQSLLWVGLFMIIVSMLVCYVFAKSFTRPLVRLSNVTEQIGKGHYDVSVDVQRHDEIGMLAASIQTMSGQLQKNESLRRQLFANIAHELRTPLAIIQGNLEGMLDDVVPLDKKTILSLEDEILRLNRLVGDLRDLSLAEVNELELHKTKQDVNAMITRAVSMLQPLVDEKHLCMHLSLDPAVQPLCLDKDRINQVIYNILSNAIRYIPAGRSIAMTTQYVAAGTDGRPWLRLIIADTGDGLRPDEVAKIFQYFYRGEKSRNRNSGGSGIGLPLAKQFVLAHGGTIRAESNVGKGLTFYISLPYEPSSGTSIRKP